MPTSATHEAVASKLMLLVMLMLILCFPPLPRLAGEHEREQVGGRRAP